MTEQQKTDEIAEINSRLNALDEQLNKAKTETIKSIEKRDKLNEESRKLRQEIQELKPERDTLNGKVQTLKLLRDEIRTKTRTIIEDIKARQEKISELRKKTPRESFEQLRKEQEDIEWKIQTTSLDLQEEKRLIENVKQLETQMAAYKKIEKQQQKIDERRKELKTLDEKADGFHQELSAIAQTSQEIHQKIITKIDESKKIKDEADSVHQAYLKSRQEAEVLEAELIGLLVQRKKIQQSLREEDAKKRETAEQALKEEQQALKEKQQALKEKLASQAREKLQRGEKLSLDEFQLLAEDESQTQN